MNLIFIVVAIVVGVHLLLRFCEHGSEDARRDVELVWLKAKMEEMEEKIRELERQIDELKKH